MDMFGHLILMAPTDHTYLTGCFQRVYPADEVNIIVNDEDEENNTVMAEEDQENEDYSLTEDELQLNMTSNEPEHIESIVETPKTTRTADEVEMGETNVCRILNLSVKRRLSFSSDDED
jgi:hypothetical protein